MATFGSLFAGIGGIDLGLERAGWECRWQVEWDPFCQHVLAHHWPDVPRYGDIAAVDWAGVERVDLLAGGFPCQPVSAAGRRKAQSDERWLWPEFHRAIRALRPRLVLVENVTNLLAINDGSAFGDVLGDLAESGYDAEWDCLPAAAVGAPHDRDRVFIVAYPNGQPVRDGTGDLAGSARAGSSTEPQRQRFRTDPLDGRTEMADTDGRGRRADERDNSAGQPNAARGGSLADPHSPRLPIGIGRGLQGGTWFGDWTQRPSDDSLADTERVDGQGIERRRHDAHLGEESPQRQVGLRSGAGRFSVGSPEPRLDRAADGLPDRLDGHRWPAPPGPQYDWEPPRVVVGRLRNRSPRVKALGNAVVPQVVEVIGRQLLAAIERAA